MNAAAGEDDIQPSRRQLSGSTTSAGGFKYNDVFDWAERRFNEIHGEEDALVTRLLYYSSEQLSFAVLCREQAGAVNSLQ